MERVLCRLWAIEGDPRSSVNRRRLWSLAEGELLLDALKGDASLFARSDGIEAAWRLIDPILSEWASDSRAAPLHTYAMNSWGPEAADALLAKGGHAWRMGCCGLPCS